MSLKPMSHLTWQLLLGGGPGVVQVLAIVGVTVLKVLGGEQVVSPILGRGTQLGTHGQVRGTMFLTVSVVGIQKLLFEVGIWGGTDKCLFGKVGRQKVYGEQACSVILWQIDWTSGGTRCRYTFSYGPQGTNIWCTDKTLNMKYSCSLFRWCSANQLTGNDILTLLTH